MPVPASHRAILPSASGDSIGSAPGAAPYRGREEGPEKYGRSVYGLSACCHWYSSDNYLFSCHALFSFPPYLQRAPRWERGTIRTRSGKTFTGVFPGSLLLSIPEQPSLFMLASALCLIICPDSVSAGGAANAAPAQVKSLAAGSCKASHGSWRTLRGSLFCPGGYPYCWYAIFKEQRGAIRSPSLSSRKLRSVNTLISRNFQKTF